MRLNFKRLGLLGSRYARAVAKLVALTPARLDFVTLLMSGHLCQRDIAAKLCVSESVVSKMVRGLMRIGMVTREVPAADKRFRVVSLTEYGRAQYATLTHCEWFMDPDVRHDAQSLGEEMWSESWRQTLEELKLGHLLSIFRFDYAGAQAPEPPYAAIRRHRHQRKRAYADPLCELGEWFFDPSWPATVRELRPPVARGMVPDPLSMALAVACERERAAREEERLRRIERRARMPRALALLSPG